MMNYIFLLMAFCGSLFAADASLIQKSVVKIVSKMQGLSAELRGSGLLFSKDGKRYVLTSDHVVAHGETFITTEATNSVSGEQLVLKFLASEWGNGLALLEVQKGSQAENAVSYQDILGEPSTKVGDSASFYGYPFESDALTEETEAKLLSFEASVPYFAFSRSLVELEAAVGEFGMSGGAAFSNQGQFLGVLAYQRILQPESTRENRVYSIPRKIVLPWLESYFKVTTKFMPYFSEPWFGQGDPSQLLLTNDGLLLMFRKFDGYFRMGIGRTEHLMILHDGPSHPYEDPKGFMKLFRKFMKDNPLRPSEFAIVDRASGKAMLKEIHYPAQVFTSFEEQASSLFFVLGEMHEERYGRIHPLIERLNKESVDLATAMKGSSSPEWVSFSKDIGSLLDYLKNIPAKPGDPGPAGSGEFFTAPWVSHVAFQIEENAKLGGWKDVESKAADLAKQLKASLQELVTNLHAWEVRPITPAL